MRKDKLETILEQIEDFRLYNLKVRSRFPYIGEGLIGAKTIITPSFYSSEGINLKIQFDREIDEYIRKENNAVGHFVNQNFIIRLYAILNYYGFVGENVNLISNSQGYYEVDIIRRLRNIYAHSLGKSNPENLDHIKLKTVIQERFGINVHDYNDFPLNIQKVIEPLIEGCKSYIIENY